MKDTNISFHTAFKIGIVDPRIFGGFLEHMERAVYEGVYQPASAHADAQAANSYEQPDLLRAVAFDEVNVKNGRVTFRLPPLSVFAATFTLE